MDGKEIVSNLVIGIVGSFIGTILFQVIITRLIDFNPSIEVLILFFSIIFFLIAIVLITMHTPTKSEAKKAPTPPNKLSTPAAETKAIHIHAVNRSKPAQIDSSGVYIKEVPKGVVIAAPQSPNRNGTDYVEYVPKQTKAKTLDHRLEIRENLLGVARRMETKQPRISGFYRMEESGKTYSPKEKKPPKEDKPYTEHTGYAKHKGTLVWYRIWVNKDNPSERQIQEVGENPFCTVCKTPLKEKRKRGYYPWLECPKCGKTFNESFKPEPTTPWLKSQIEDDLRERGIIPDD